MKYEVNIMFVIDTADYEGCGDEETDASELGHTMMDGEADFPNHAIVKATRLPTHQCLNCRKTVVMDNAEDPFPCDDEQCSHEWEPINLEDKFPRILDDE